MASHCKSSLGSRNEYAMTMKHGTNVVEDVDQCGYTMTMFKDFHCYYKLTVNIQHLHVQAVMEMYQ